MYYVYILYSARLDRYYVGSTNDIERRMLDHNRGKTSYARQGMPWELKYTEQYHTRSEAMRRESQIKQQKSRVYIESLIKGTTV